MLLCFQGANGDLYATPELLKLRFQFEDLVLRPIRMKKAEQPRLDPPEVPAYHVNCKCQWFFALHLYFYLHILLSYSGSRWPFVRYRFL